VLAAEAAQLVAGFPEVTFTWVPRAQNAAADALANAAMDAAAAGKVWSPSVDLPVSGGAEVSTRAAPAAGTHGLGSGWGRPSGAPTETVLLRHGQTALSIDGRFSGLGTDPVLTDEGRAQARRAAERLAGQPFDAVITSPLRRAAETARIVAGGRDVVTVDGLRETDFGAFEGLTFREASAQWPDELKAWMADPAVAPPGGESFETTDQRVAAALSDLLEEYRGQRLLVVSHVTPIKLLIRRALEAPMSSLYRLHLELASVSTIDWYPDGPAVVRAVNA
jgi:probable phosphoglycerate mutase